MKMDAIALDILALDILDINDISELRKYLYYLMIKGVKEHRT
jgi:hypothetical protein